MSVADKKPCPSRARPGRGRSVPNHGIRARARRARSTRGGEVPEERRTETSDPRPRSVVRLRPSRHRRRRHRQPRAHLGYPGRPEGHRADVQLRREHQPVHPEPPRHRSQRQRRRQGPGTQAGLHPSRGVRVPGGGCRRRREKCGARRTHARRARDRAPHIQDGARRGAPVGDRIRDEGDRRRRRRPPGVPSGRRG